MMEITVNTIYDEYILTFGGVDYVKDIDNPYRFISTNIITSIGDYAFHNRKNLTNIIIPDSVTTIGECAFLGCLSLTQIIIPDSVHSIGECAFIDCRSLTNIIIPASVTTISNDIFRYCTSLTQVETNDENAYIIEYCKTNYPEVKVIVTNTPYVLK